MSPKMDSKFRNIFRSIGRKVGNFGKKYAECSENEKKLKIIFGVFGIIFGVLGIIWEFLEKNSEVAKTHIRIVVV